MSKLIDLTGQEFDRLTVISRAQNAKDGRARWVCQCNCGQQTIVSGSQLRNGSVKSCGCLQKDKARQIMKTKIQKLGAKARLQDLAGKQFGYLTVLERDLSYKQNRPYWKCSCRCGNTKTVFGQLLINGSVQSCGCLGNSIGEAIIADLLKENNIKFIQEYKFLDLKDQSYLRYDFAILNDKDEVIKLIEYDGRQHTDPNSGWHNEKVILHDQMKTDYAKQHNIPLIRISYKDKDLISLDFLEL